MCNFRRQPEDLEGGDSTESPPFFY
jgi:hypothetical protein